MNRKSQRHNHMEANIYSRIDQWTLLTGGSVAYPYVRSDNSHLAHLLEFLSLKLRSSINKLVFDSFNCFIRYKYTNYCII